MAMTGFDPSVVNQSIGAVNAAYENLMYALGDQMQNQFVGGLADKWACNSAVNFFNTAFKPAVDELLKSANMVFESVVSSMNSAAQAWAQQTESSYAAKPFSAITKTIDVSGIQENIGGIRGIDLDTATTVAGKLPAIASSATEALTKAQQAVQNCGFVGGNQAGNLIASLGVIKDKISNATETITTQTKSAIDTTIQQYGDLEGKVSQAFSAQ